MSILAPTLSVAAYTAMTDEERAAAHAWVDNLVGLDHRNTPIDAPMAYDTSAVAGVVIHRFA